MTPTLAPNTTLVMQTWLKDVVGIVNAGTVLPADESSWKTDGFVQFTAVAGSPDIYTLRRNPLIQLDFWAVSPGSNKAPWGQANDLAERVLTASQDPTKYAHGLTLGGNFKPARVLSTYFIDEPRAIRDQSNDAARFMAQMQLVWTVA